MLWWCNLSFGEWRQWSIHCYISPLQVFAIGTECYKYLYRLDMIMDLKGNAIKIPCSILKLPHILCNVFLNVIQVCIVCNISCSIANSINSRLLIRKIDLYWVQPSIAMTSTYCQLWVIAGIQLTAPPVNQSWCAPIWLIGHNLRHWSCPSWPPSWSNMALMSLIPMFYIPCSSESITPSVSLTCLIHSHTASQPSPPQVGPQHSPPQESSMQLLGSS